MPFINKSPLNYPLNTESSIRIFETNRAPTTSDFKNFIVGDEWWDTDSNDFWKLVFKDSNQGIWRKMAGTAAAVEFVTPDIGGQVGPDGANNINLLGGGGLTTTGNPGINTITIAPSNGGDLIETLTGDLGGPVGPDGVANIDILGSGGITVTGNPGANSLTIAPSSGGSLVETLTGNVGGPVGPDAVGNIDIVGTATNGIEITGNPGINTLTAAMNTPYADGDFEFRNTTAATSRTLSVTNTDVNVASSAELLIETEPLSADAFLRTSINGTTEFSYGIDNSDSDKLKITDSFTPSLGNEIITINPSASNDITFNGSYTFPTIDGTAGQVLATDGAGNVDWQSTIIGEIVQVVRNNTTALIAVNAAIPQDNTIPQQTEGVQILTVTITPTSATNLLYIEFESMGRRDASAGTNAVNCALFQDATLNALAATHNVSLNDTWLSLIYISYYMIAGTTSPTTFKIRIGSSGGKTFNVNDANYGNVCVTRISVMEINA